MKKLLLILMIIISLLMVSCVNKVNSSNNTESTIEVKLTDVEGKYIIDDMRSLGTWLLMFEKDEIEAFSEAGQVFTCKIGSAVYEMKMNPFNDGLYIAFLPEELDLEVIKRGSIVAGDIDTTTDSRNTGTISLEKVTIEKGELNGTTLYEMTLELYVYFNTSSDGGIRGYLYHGDTFLKPKYVRSDEEDGYLLDLYYNARAASAVRTTDAAFRFLQARPDHEATLLVNYDANRVSVNGEIIVEDVPDDRDRVRELGSMGDMSGNNAWNIVDDSANSLFNVFVKKSELPAAYQTTNEFSMSIKGATECDFYETSTAGVFEATVSYSDTSGMELLKNARFFISNPFDGGAGTQADPYRVADWKQLAGIRNKEEYLAKHYVLINNLDSSSAFYNEYASLIANGGAGWNPIGNSAVVYFSGGFNGEYLGAKHSITDLKLNRSEQGCGLFGFVGDGAQLNNITIANAEVNNGANDTGLLVGQIVDQIFIEGCIAEGTVTSTGGSNTGLLVGFNQYGSIKSSHASGAVTGGTNVGIIVGYSYHGTVDKSFSGEGLATANVTAAGGLAGRFEASSMRDCYSRAAANGGSNTGGIIGYSISSSIDNSYSTGDVNGTDYIGGFIGYKTSTNITNCYSIGEATGSGSNIGGFVGIGSGGITSSYWLNTTSGVSSGGAISKTDAEMRLEATFDGWIFIGESEGWLIYSGARTSYPYLVSNPQDPAPGM